MINSNQQALFALVRAGLWEQDVRLFPYGKIDYNEVLRLASEQAVVGLVAAGMDKLPSENRPSQDILLQFIGTTMQLEQRNKAMNQFIAQQVEEMRKADIYAVLVKGQGIAQCYEKPLWRSNGDVDYLLSVANYQKAKSFLAPLATNEKPERQYSKEKGYYIDQWLIELHGSLHTGLSSKVDRMIDKVQNAVFDGGCVRTWQNGRTKVFLPGVDEDVFLVFTHFLKHFYKEGGVTLRQLCDCCRLLWTYRVSLNHGLLETRLRNAGLMSEWQAFAAVAIEWFGMLETAMPLFSGEKKWQHKASQIVEFILKGGEWHKWKDTMAVARIFPVNTFRFLPGILFNVTWLKVKDRVINR